MKPNAPQSEARPSAEGAVTGFIQTHPIKCQKATLERLEHQHGGMLTELREIDQILGKALGCPEYDESFFPDGKPDGSVCTGDHTPVTLADAAARQLRRAEALPGEWREPPIPYGNVYATGRYHARTQCADELERALRGEADDGTD